MIASGRIAGKDRAALQTQRNDRKNKGMAMGPEIVQRRRIGQMGRLAALLLLAGCGTPAPAPKTTVSLPEPVLAPDPRPAELASLQYTIKPGIGTQCVPYARARTGIDIFGNAHTWWDSAAGRYARGNLPMVGSVLVLRKTSRLRYGHLGVVSKVIGPREIRVDHANWQPDAVITNMAVIDVSPANDWSQLRFWNKEARMWGRVYPAAGFIYDVPAGVTPPAGTTVISSGNATNGAEQQTTP
jgi:surface antigen